ncbi:hypothetical protein HII36_20945 [Nonomuraea sp. NN258]|uniref:hypothetical protein n=1 Tax=Nonomuraea antri TaxID=2730852 RepID=UPI001568A872|nr:hypothetical protein [Nonomuraea antri]NRQ34300.1 hypothetical protein [Nonomuraea antri]
MHLDTEGFYSWTASDDDDGRGACGITSDPGRAAVLLLRALKSLTPGASGSVQIVRLDRQASHPSYIYGATLLRLCRLADGVAGARAMGSCARPAEAVGSGKRRRSVRGTWR